MRCWAKWEADVALADAKKAGALPFAHYAAVFGEGLLRPLCSGRDGYRATSAASRCSTGRRRRTSMGYSKIIRPALEAVWLSPSQATTQRRRRHGDPSDQRRSAA